MATRDAIAKLLYEAPMRVDKSTVRIEPAHPEDAGAMLIVHRAAIRGQPSRTYSPEIIEDWGPLPVRAENIEGLASRIVRGEEEAVVARNKVTGRIIGFGSIVPAAEELRAVYVDPDYERSGIGSMIVRELEANARKYGLAKLRLASSLNAESFYRHHGFEVESHSEHILHSGRQMPCIRMFKYLDASAAEIRIDVALVHHLIATQFPRWAAFPIQPAEPGGWDNRSFRLGKHMLVRLPSAAVYAPQVEKEQRWLPRFAPLLPLSIPTPLAMGVPAEGYPWPWSVYRWIEGETAADERIANEGRFAVALARFLSALQNIDCTGGPPPGPHNFYRGGPLTVYDAEARRAISDLGTRIDADLATAVWESALGAQWHGPPVWVHGDVSAGNLLVRGGRLSAVIDFGSLGVGDPACDLVIAWTLFSGVSRTRFQSALPADAATWARGRGWANGQTDFRVNYERCGQRPLNCEVGEAPVRV